MPGVLQIEAMAQTAGALVLAGMEDLGDKKPGVFFMSIDGVKFRKPVKPGDQLMMHVEKVKERGKVFVFKGESRGRRKSRLGSRIYGNDCDVIRKNADLQPRKSGAYFL